VYAAVQVPATYVYALGSSLDGVSWVPYWTVLALGYAVMLAIGLTRPGPLGAVAPRAALDAWLLVAPLAVVAAMAMTIYRWPLAFDTWEGHGVGVNGGEANSVLFPWVHALLWVLVLAYVGTRYPSPSVGEGNA
jgi:hypothetical protein